MVKIDVAGLLHQLDPFGTLSVNMGGQSKGSKSCSLDVQTRTATISSTEGLSLLLTLLMPDHSDHRVRIRVPLEGCWKWLTFDVAVTAQDEFRSYLGR